jgi:hypothetical protein
VGVNKVTIDTGDTEISLSLVSLPWVEAEIHPDNLTV